MPLVFLPNQERLFLWGEPGAERLLPELVGLGEAAQAELLLPEGTAQVSGQHFALETAAPKLALTPAASVSALPAIA